MKNVLFVLAFVVLVGGCAVERQAVFDESEFAPYGNPGTARLSGRVVLESSLGNMIGVEEPVYLFPATSYNAEWYDIVVLKNRRISSGDPRSKKFTRVGRTDSVGIFKFTNLPAGSYYLICPVKLDVPFAYQRGGYQYMQGWRWGIAHQVIEIAEGQTYNVILGGQLRGGSPTYQSYYFSGQAEK